MRSGSPPTIERGLARAATGALAPEAMQELMAALCKIYSAQVENGAEHPPIAGGPGVSPTGRDGHGERPVAGPPISPCSNWACGRAGPGASARFEKEIRRDTMDLIADRGRRVTVEELNTSRLLAHARKQAKQRKFDDMLIVDVDAHHYENEHIGDILPFMENDVLRQLSHDRTAPRARHTCMPQRSATRTWAAASRATRCAHREDRRRASCATSQLGHRWMDAMSVDYSCLFPTGMLVDRPASAERNGGRAVLGLQPLAHREGAAGSPTAASSRC